MLFSLLLSFFSFCLPSSFTPFLSSYCLSPSQSLSLPSFSFSFFHSLSLSFLPFLSFFLSSQIKMCMFNKSTSSFISLDINSSHAWKYFGSFHEHWFQMYTFITSDKRFFKASFNSAYSFILRLAFLILAETSKSGLLPENVRNLLVAFKRRMYLLPFWTLFQSVPLKEMLFKAWLGVNT
jgi:hypothetical protein